MIIIFFPIKMMNILLFQVKALSAGLQDITVLVQRSSLDLLLVGFPLHNSNLVKDDVVTLVTAALTTILRRDKSLTRRLYAWLLGSEVNASLLSLEHPLVKKIEEMSNVSQSSVYFEMYSKEFLIQVHVNLHSFFYVKVSVIVLDRLMIFFIIFLLGCQSNIESKE